MSARPAAAMQTPSPWRPAAAIAAWVVPGLGHYLIGEKNRGLIIGVTIVLMWLTGLLIGGIGVIDNVQHRAWFCGQMLTAPSVVVNMVRQSGFAPPAADAEASSYEPSFGHVKEQGILYTALAGLLNLLAILDVAYREPQR